MVGEETKCQLKLRGANRWKKLEIIRTGKRDKDASTPRLLIVVSRQGQTQPSEDVSNPVSGQCPTSSCRVLVENNWEKYWGKTQR